MQNNEGDRDWYQGSEHDQCSAEHSVAEVPYCFAR